MLTLTIAEVQAHLPELIDHLAPGEEVVITRGDRTVAKLIGPNREKPTPVYGSCKGMLHINVEDDEHLKDFSEYMP